MFTVSCTWSRVTQTYSRLLHSPAVLRRFSGKHDYIYYSPNSNEDFSNPRYEDFYRRSIDDKESFWAELAQDVHWHK